MKERWSAAESILCVRLDGPDEVLTTTPAIRALKNGAPERRLSLLTSPQGAAVGRLVPEIDDVIVYQAPWAKSTPSALGSDEIVSRLRRDRFDAAVVFTAASQSALPGALLCLWADIPLRVAYCRENPYHLLTDCVREVEPETGIRPDVRRQLDLVAAIGAHIGDERLSLEVPVTACRSIEGLLDRANLDRSRPWAVVHPGPSGESPEHLPNGFAAIARDLVRVHGVPVVFTGTSGEAALVDEIRLAAGVPSVSLAGRLDVAELAAVLAAAHVAFMDDTGPMHVAAAVGTPVVNLHSLGSQKAPWALPSKLLPFYVPCPFCDEGTSPGAPHRCRATGAQTVVQASRDFLESPRGPALQASAR